MKPAPWRKGAARAVKLNQRRDLAWMLGPTLLALSVFFWLPVLLAAITSLFDWDLLTPPRYVGLENYRALSESSELWHMLKNTVVLSFVVVLASMGIGLSLALALNHKGWFTAWVRGAVFSAYVVSWVSVALLWMWLLDGKSGLLNHWLGGVGLPAPDWLGSTRWALLSVAAVTVWKVAGYAMVLFLAGLQDVPRDLHEAAGLDGASRLQRFLYVTWPELRPITAFVAITSLIFSFQVFDVVRVMTQGGPVHSTTVFVYGIYEQVFLDLRVGRASAVALVFFVILLLLSCLKLWWWRRSEAI
jgi:ABC-type sugar transport system permease subunit